MRIMKQYRYLLFCTMAMVMSCKTSPKVSRKPITKIQASQTVVQGESLKMNFESSVKNGKIQEVQLFLDGTEIHSSTDLVSTLNISSDTLSLGNHRFRVVAEKEDGVRGVKNHSFTVLSDQVPKRMTYKVVNTYPHPVENFTQGLEFYNDRLFESTGEKGYSGIYELDLKTGDIERKKALEERFFGEGMTIVGDRLYQLTYHAQSAFIYDVETFENVGSFQYQSKEGWGLTHMNDTLVMSDGTHMLSFIDRDTFKKIGSIQVTNHRGVVRQINELEMINGSIYANVWLTNIILRIDPKTGQVLEEIDMTGLIDYFTTRNIDVLNGIAYNPKSGKIYVTGKRWPLLFEVEFVEQ